MIGYWVPSWNYYYNYEFEIILMYGLDGTCTLSMYNKRWEWMKWLCSFSLIWLNPTSLNIKLTFRHKKTLCYIMFDNNYIFNIYSKPVLVWKLFRLGRK